MKKIPIWTALILLVALPVSAQTAPGEFVEAIDVRVVNVEAVVTDRKGERVRGLEPEDFQLLVDGKEVPVQFFTEIVEGTAMSASGSDGAEPEAVGRSVLVFVDDKFTIAPQRNRVLKRVEESLAKKTPLRFMSYQEPRPGDVVGFQTTLRLRRRPQNVIFTVRDNLSGEMLWTNLDYRP